MTETRNRVDRARSPHEGGYAEMGSPSSPPSPLRITSAHLTPASDADRRSGLLGYIQVVLDGGLQLDGITLRETRDGRITLSFPARRDRHGREHAIIRPVDATSRVQIVKAILRALDGPEAAT